MYSLWLVLFFCYTLQASPLKELRGRLAETIANKAHEAAEQLCDGQLMALVKKWDQSVDDLRNDIDTMMGLIAVMFAMLFATLGFTVIFLVRIARALDKLQRACTTVKRDVEYKPDIGAALKMKL